MNRLSLELCFFSSIKLAEPSSQSMKKNNRCGPNPKGIGGPAPAADGPAAEASDDSETGEAETEESSSAEEA